MASSVFKDTRGRRQGSLRARGWLLLNTCISPAACLPPPLTISLHIARSPSSSNPHCPIHTFERIFILVKFSTYFITICSPNLSVDGNTVEATVAQVLQKVAGVGVDGDGLLLEGRDLGDEVHSALTLLLLKLEGDAADGALVNALHEVGGEAGDLVAHALGGGDGNLVDNSLVGVEVHRETGVVLLHDGLRRLLDGLGSDTLLCWSVGGSHRSQRNDEGKNGVRIRHEICTYFSVLTQRTHTIALPPHRQSQLKRKRGPIRSNLATNARTRHRNAR